MVMKTQMIHFKTNLVPDPTFYFGNRIIDQLPRLLNEYPHDRIYLVTTKSLSDMYGEEISDILSQSSIAHEVVVINDGEDQKTFQNLEYLCETLVEKNISKGSIILGFGGGCLTNIAGLAAGLIFRGVRYVEMPTTLMGITDSTLSNKQAVNGKHGKNQFGMYYAPVFIFGDTKYLVTEPILSKKSAIVEGIKNGLISDSSLLDYFEAKLKHRVDMYNEAEIHELALKIIQSKLKILERDPSEKAYAMTLEYGHTFGHAMEFLTKGKVPHGAAVAKGMCIAAELSYFLGIIPRTLVDRHYHILGELLGLDLTIPPELSVEAIMHAILSDNKKVASGIKYVLLKDIGECLNPDGDFQVYVKPEIVKQVLLAYKKASDINAG